jgi:hypothetical protein
MKKIKTTDIIAGSAMPLKSGSLDHLQSAYQEPLIDIIQTFEAKNDTEAFPNYSTPIIMYGCRWTGTGVSQGVVVYGTEIYRCQAVNITLGVGQVVIGTITTTYLTATNADPVIFSDSTSNNLHEIRQIVWSAGTTGSGDFDLDDCLMWGRWQDVTYSASYLTAATGNWTLPGGASDWQVRWKQVGRTVIIDFYVFNSTLSASPANIKLTLPFNANFLKDHHAICYYQNPAATPTAGACRVIALAGTTNLQFIPATTTWVADTGTVDVYGQITVELDKF